LPEPLLVSEDGRFAVVQSQPWMAEALEAIQEASFPTLSREERMTKEHYLSHMRIFPEGQHAVVELPGGKVVACLKTCTYAPWG